MRILAKCSFLAAVASACLLLAGVKTDYHHHIDFTRYRTYSWIKVQAQDIRFGMIAFSEPWTAS